MITVQELSENIWFNTISHNDSDSDNEYSTPLQLFCFSIYFFQMIASSLQAARKLVERSEFSIHETRANNGVLIGKGYPHVITREEGPNIKTCLTSNNSDIRETPSMAKIYKSALLPLLNFSCGGTVYKSGNEVSMLLQGEDDAIMKVIHFYLL